MEKELTVLILQYNGSELTIELLHSILLHEKKSIDKYDIYVIDNNSTENDMFREMEKLFPFVKLIKNEKNYGFAMGINHAIKKIKSSKYMLLINNDAVLMNNAINLSLSHIKSKNYDAVTCKMLNGKYKIMNNFSSNPHPIKRLFFNLLGLHKIWITIVKKFNLSVRVGYINGGFLLMKTDSFIEVGMFYDKYFMYTEDIDLMIKFNKNNYKLSYCPSGKVLHYDGVSSAKIWSDFEKTKLQLIQVLDCYRRHYSYINFNCFRLYSLFVLVKNTLITGKMKNLQLIRLLYR